MVHTPGAAFMMGDDHAFREERPCHSVTVDAFWMDRQAVTISQFAAFVAKTGYETVAERPLDQAMYPRAKRAMLNPCALVFGMTQGPVDTSNVAHWWHWTPGAQWRRPGGPGSLVPDDLTAS